MVLLCVVYVVGLVLSRWVFFLISVVCVVVLAWLSCGKFCYID